MTTMSMSLRVGEVVWLRPGGNEKDGTKEEGIFVADNDGQQQQRTEMF